MCVCIYPSWRTPAHTCKSTGDTVHTRAPLCGLLGSAEAAAGPAASQGHRASPTGLQRPSSGPGCRSNALAKSASCPAPSLPLLDPSPETYTPCATHLPSLVSASTLLTCAMCVQAQTCVNTHRRVYVCVRRLTRQSRDSQRELGSQEDNGSTLAMDHPRHRAAETCFTSGEVKVTLEVNAYLYYTRNRKVQRTCLSVNHF